MKSNSLKRSSVVHTADVIAEYRGKIVLIDRLRFPLGLALPGGHIEKGERPITAAIREFKEETGLTLHDAKFLFARSGKHRDPRYGMSKTRVFTGVARGTIRNEKGRTRVTLKTREGLRKLPEERFAFDHRRIVEAYLDRDR